MKKITLILFAFFNLSLAGKSQNIYTVVGNGTTGFSGDGGIATAAEVNAPQGVIVDSSGNIYITDSFNNRIRKVDAIGIITTIGGTGVSGFNSDGIQATNAELYFPHLPAFDLSGNFCFTDAGNVRVRRIDLTTGIITTIAGNGGAGYGGDGSAATSAEIGTFPGGIAFDSTGNFYIADHNNMRVRKVNTNGIITTFAGNGVAGNNGDGGPATLAEIGVGGNGAVGVTVDFSGNILFTDNGNENIRKVNTLGIISTFAGIGTAGFSGDGGQATAAEFYDPVSITSDKSGNVIICDLSNYRIREIDPLGIITTIAGNGFSGFSGDGGPATLAELSGAPFGVALDSHGNLFISDQSNSRIRKVDSISVMTHVDSKITSAEMNILPNPASDKFFIETGNLKEQTECTLFSISGQKVYSTTIRPFEKVKEISCSSLCSGTYILEIRNTDGMRLVKKVEVVKQ